MGHSVWSDIVPFVAHGIARWDGCDDDEFSQLENPECWIENYGSDKQIEAMASGLSEFPIVQGWSCLGYVEFGKRRKLTGWSWVKDRHTICTINESHYSNGGDVELSIVANDKESITVFLNDFKDLLTQNHLVIEENDTVEQSG